MMNVNSLTFGENQHKKKLIYGLKEWKLHNTLQS